MIVADKNRAVIESAIVLARLSGAEAVVLAATLPEEAEILRSALEGEQRIIMTTERTSGPAPHDGDLLVLPEVRLRRRGRAKIALLEGLAAGIRQQGERVIVISGNRAGDHFELDTIAIVELSAETGYPSIEGLEPLRSEERRVGKECSPRRWREPCNTKRETKTSDRSLPPDDGARL